MMQISTRGSQAHFIFLLHPSFASRDNFRGRDAWRRSLPAIQFDDIDQLQIVSPSVRASRCRSIPAISNYLGLCSLWYGRFPRTSLSRRSLG